MSEQSSPYLIGIAGGSGSGKTTFAELVKASLPTDSSEIISTDSYYFDNSKLTQQEKDRFNYDHPDAVEFDLLYDHLLLLRQGAGVKVPQYDFQTHERTTKPRFVLPRPIMIVEGILSLSDQRVRQLYDHLIFVDTSEKERFERRMQRDIAQRGRTFESVHYQWSTTVLPMHREYCEPTKEFANRVIDGESDFSDPIRVFIADLYNKKLLTPTDF